MSNETGGPAFPALPIHRDSNGEILYQCEGLTVRDYFAAKAMAIVMPSVLEEIRNRRISDADVTKLKRVSAEACYGIADEMLEARK